MPSYIKFEQPGNAQMKSKSKVFKCSRTKSDDWSTFGRKKSIWNSTAVF